MAGLFGLIGLLVGGGAMLHNAVREADSRSTPYETTRDGMPVSLTLKGEKYINGEVCKTVSYSEYGITYYKTVGKRSGRVYEDTKDTVNDKWEREARKSYEENKAKGNIGYLKLNPRLHYSILTEMSTGKQIAEVVRYSKNDCYKEYLDPNGSYPWSGDGNKISISNEEFERLARVQGGFHHVFDHDENKIYHGRY